GRIAECVKKHVGEVSAPCQQLLASAAAAAKTCTDDVKQHCADAKRRTAKIACLKSALSNLSDGCKSAISQFAAARKKPRLGRRGVPARLPTEKYACSENYARTAGRATAALIRGDCASAFGPTRFKFQREEFVDPFWRGDPAAAQAHQSASQA